MRQASTASALTISKRNTVGNAAEMNFANARKRLIFGARPFTLLLKLTPGIALTSAIAAIAISIRQIPLFSSVGAIMWALVIGIALRAVIKGRTIFDDGISFSLRWILRLAIVLLGLQISIDQIALIGIRGVSILVVATVSAFVFTMWFGRLLKVDRELTQLLAAGTSICGASAIVAANAVIRADEEDVVYALASVTAYGSIFMIVYPWLADALALDPIRYGIWAGSSVHEVAQVVAATFSSSKEAGEFGTISKLGRVVLLAPTIVVLGAVSFRENVAGKLGQAGVQGANCAGINRSKAPVIPWFVIGFAVMVAVANSNLFVRPVPYVATATAIMLTISLAALGLKTDLRKLRSKGTRPVLLGAGSSLFIAALSLILILSLY